MKKRDSLFRRIIREKFEDLLSDTIRKGSLVVEMPSGDSCAGGDGSGRQVRIRITSWKALTRIVLYPDLAVGEAYMDGDLVMLDGEMYDLLDLIFTNMTVDEPSGLSSLTRRLVRLFVRLLDYNSPTRSRRNVAHHYDLDRRLYDLFLDSDRQYSCGYFETPGDGLEEAQLAKKRHLAAKMNLEPGQRVLDIGSGWGGLALYLARMYDASVLGVTLSDEQLAISNERARAEKREGQVDFKLRDYRSLTGRFDRIVSVGMFEHVGKRSYGEFFAKVRDLLEDDGVGVLHYIGRTTAPYVTNGWVRKYIFPGGYLPSLSEVMPEIERNGLTVTDVEVLRLHYADTLRHWRKRFMANRMRAVELYDKRFARMWEFYLAGAETGFRYQGLVIHQIQFAKSVSALPVTRDYMTENEEGLRQRDRVSERSQTAAG
ncbi:SAM-dependent methyltransferase [Paracoccus saliphilus]|uniref:Class I SAM-dependent methyltransferase n=1 Tax=Paracoccus saliphilus TaxID=405559 RepID=A0AA45W5Q5_9RHOB|nr:cyclopropane-fatty-acyl-phospholipid synthase family protein [Paracoccus saliphilus]WCR05565.1 class I SAM-dependent methyltransferase [Paracoccus saliphilus]SIS95674.1 cyclopropane-fatty-acyl-phospholipid synthase [Paracoccus saliphilus]